ncbi:CCA tRNA nucleotidyltransferase [Cognatishimia sp. MH4019]|uniref:CCA tRNA nucleotidyltransferase n=1 Tax=Cognatishimia sp. MH4019 TaxID=2854030 RepID=UPI001CD7AA7C|nr:CCA tRNA nucleotidyltransferase [Cognatishimia sp. MH4019]
MTRINADWVLSPPARKVMTLLRDGGHQAYFVGGCVRNALLEAQVTDLDIATDALPNAVLALSDASGLKAIPTGLEHGTVTVIADGVPFEITTFRKDIDTDGRHATVAFTDDLTQDARRRDFTMNALYADSDGRVVDPLNGLPDLQAGKLRFIDDAAQRIREDYLRILRFFRFHAWYADPAGGFDPDGLSACAALADGLADISKERIGAEMLKLLAAPDPGPSLGAMQQSGVLAQVLPGSDPKASFLVIATHPIDPILRLAALGGEAPAAYLRLSKSDARRVEVLRDAATSTQTPGALGYRLGAVDAVGALHLRAAFFEQPVNPDDCAKAEKSATRSFPIKAADLMPAYQGAALGKRLKEMEEAWIASDFTLSKSDLMRL